VSNIDWMKIVQGGGGDNGQGPPEFDFNLEPQQIFKALWTLVLVGLIGWGGLTGYYTVEANEEAVILRLGNFEKVSGPGFHAKLPFGIDKAYKGAIKTVHQAEFGYRTISAGQKSQFDYRSPMVVAEATMLTGDLNLVMVNWEVRFKIKDLKSYLFEVRSPVDTLRDTSEAVMRTQIGDRSVDEALTLDRTVIENEVAKNMQTTLDEFKCGIQIVKVNLKRVDPPDDVRDAFNAVNRAIQIRDRIVNEAEGERNKKIPAARGEKERAIKEAEGYKIGRLNRADGETKAFLSVLAEYRKAEDITRRRLYIEAMQKSLPKVGDLTLLDSQDKGVLKLLDLNSRTKRQGDK
jgi:modulator of FtsH protease HflK